jgi:hypothetical protein
MCQVSGHLDIGDRDQADPRVVQIETDEPGQFTLDLFGDTPRPGVGPPH